jgi:cobalt/nickel transport system permease protein
VIHALPAHYKILSLVSFLFVVVATPITHWKSYLGFFLLIALLILSSKLPILTVLRRSLIEIPFILFAVLMPFFGTGDTFQVFGATLYEEGLLAAAGIVAKGTLGVLGAITLSGSTTARELLRGLERLKLPSLMVNIASFTLRYINVVTDEMERMKIARAARGFEARGIRDWKILGHVLGALFIRSYERGERVHLAMLSRGYTGAMPELAHQQVAPRLFITATTLPILALTISLVDWTIL